MSDEPLFPLGAIRTSERAIAAIESAAVTLQDLLERHQQNDSDSSANDRQLNRTAIQLGGHVRSVFRLGEDDILIETAGERNVTIVCVFPDEY